MIATVKTALISPAVNSQTGIPSAEDEKQLFEEKFGQMAYQAFSSKFPDLVPEIVTFKILDSDLEIGTGIGAFIIEQEGDYIYVPAVISENELKPFDLMYVKSKDIFLPLSEEWLEEISKGTVDSLGEGVKLPDTVATDVDIRNIVVPPTTGRYSYASFKVSPRNRLEASASEPLGRRLTKMAQLGPFPGTGGGESGGSGNTTDENFNPELWATFVEQFQRVQQMTPGQALDSQQLDAETLSKMYKSHQKTWEMMNSSGPAGAAAMQEQQAMQQQQQMMQPPGAPAQGAQQGMQVTASVKRANAPETVARTMGSKLDSLLANAAKASLVGGGMGGYMAAQDDDLSDLPSGVLRGAVGGMLLSPLGGLAGEDISARLAKGAPTPASKGRMLGSALGAAFGGAVGGASDPIPPAPSYNNYSSSSVSLGDAVRSLIPGASLLRMASDHTEGLRDMMKHALAKSHYENKLPEFLTRSPNNVKKAYIRVLDKNPRLLKQAVDLYGEDVLLQALSKKEAGISISGGGLYVADKNSKAKDYDAFGEAAPEAFAGVLTRGYYFKDTRKNLNVAAQVQKYHDFEDTMGSGVYSLYNTGGTPIAALVLVEPFSLTNSDRFTFPRNEKQVKPLRNKVPAHTQRREPHNLPGFDSYGDSQGADIERSHTYSRLAILGNGDYVKTDKLFGEKVTEHLLKGTELWSSLFSDKRKEPTRGKGCFVAKKGSSYVGTLPVEIVELSTGSNGIVRGKLNATGGWESVSFVTDPKATRPMKLQDQKLVIIPASWAWVSLHDEKDGDDFLRTPDAVSRLVLDNLENTDVKEAMVRDAGAGMFAIDRQYALPKKEAMVKIANKYAVHMSAAEAMLKIASHEGICRSYIMSPATYHALTERVKIAQGTAVPQGAPPAMQQAPAGPPGAPPGAPPGMPPGMPPAMQGAPPAAPPEPQAPSAVDQAFGESMQMLQQQMEQLQAQLDVLMMVQQRAQQIETGQDPSAQAQPMDPSMDPSMQGMPPGGGQPGQPPIDATQSMQGMPPGMDPSMGVDPSMMDPAMQGGGGEQPQEPPTPIMHTEEPSMDEIGAQINPAFLENAGRLHETGAFDAGTIASLAQNSTMKSITSDYAANLESSIDDLGRSLLTLYMQEPQLKEQLGDQTFVDLENQMRDTFHGLGKLVLSMTHNASMLDPRALA